VKHWLTGVLTIAATVAVIAVLNRTAMGKQILGY
jgi:hypothetical protein